MSQVWHLFRNDLRASKYLLTVWLAALAAYVAAAWRDPLTMETNIHASAIGALTMVVGVVVAAILIQQDSLVGERSFWMTRPIRRWSLLGAKALFIGVVLIGAQLVACTALLLRFGMPPAELPSLLIQISGEWVWLLAAAVVLATVTAGTAQFITAGLIAYVATVWGVMNVGLVLNGVRYDYDFFSEAALAACCVLIALRYAGLSRWKTMGAVAACWAGLILFPLAGWERAKESRQPAAAPPASVTLRAAYLNPSDEGFHAAFDGGGDARSEGFVVRWEVVGLEPDQALRIDELHGEVLWDDGEVTWVEGQMLGRVRGDRPASGLDFGAIGNRPVSIVIFHQLADPESVYGKQGVLRARVTGRLQRIENYGLAPVVTGATLEGAGYAVRLESVLSDSDRTAIHFRERRIAGVDERANWPQPIIVRRDTGTRLLENAANGVGWRRQGWVTGWPVIDIRERDLVYEWRKQGPEIVDRGPEWLERAEITAIGYSPGRSVALDLEMPGFRIIPNAGTRRR